MTNNSDDLVRHPTSKALISSDDKGYKSYIQQRERNSRIIQLNQEMNTLKSELGEIKSLLVKLTNGK